MISSLANLCTRFLYRIYIFFGGGWGVGGGLFIDLKKKLGVGDVYLLVFKQKVLNHTFAMSTKEKIEQKYELQKPVHFHKVKVL